MAKQKAEEMRRRKFEEARQEVQRLIEEENRVI